ncbi:chaperone protein HscA [Citrobacter freundii]|nr:chaperone protein HscA [Citrobacter freundii]
MALLQISEPGLSAAPHQRRLAVGIDLGTTNSLVATVRSGQAETLADHEGRHLLPSVVHYQQQGYSVGYDARANAALDTAKHRQFGKTHDGPLSGGYPGALPASAIYVPGKRKRLADD